MIEEITSKTFTDKYGILYFDVKVEKADSQVCEKRLPLPDYISMLRGVENKKIRYDEIVRLPSEVIWAAQSRTPDTFAAVVMLPESVRPVFYMGNIFPNIPFPKLCARILVNKGTRTETQVFAVKGDGLDAELYDFPYGNVSSDGRCCYGNIVVSGIRNAADSVRVLEAFLEGETNADLYHGQCSGFQSQADLYEFLSGKKKFPMRLVSAKRGSVKDLCTA